MAQRTTKEGRMMLDFLSEWELATRVYFYIAVTGSVVYLFKLLSSWIGIDADPDFELELDNDSDFQLITIQTVSLFLLAFGWMGVFSTTSNLESFLSFGIAFVFAVISVTLEIWLFFKIKKLEQIPKFPVEDCIGLTGQVYLVIPEKGQGEVQVSVHGKRKIFKAIAENGQRIDSFRPVRITGVNGNQLIVIES
jgi:membrane protein implicated in regulation of membrane protease activity